MYHYLKCLKNWTLTQAAAHIGQDMSDWVNIARGVSQRYADDTAMVADSEQLQNLMDVIAEESRNFGLVISKRKTFSMPISRKNTSPKSKIEMNGIEVKPVEIIEYLRSLITSDAKSDQEIKRRIGIPKTTFKSMPGVLSPRNINYQTKRRLIKCYTWSTTMHGRETWTTSEAIKKELEATEMWFLRRMTKI
ncbi:uncharacterized protein [Penaeus vannamei]|uniref:uncharacterized protein n=1 Tax=Penaeus vannamei TaxID=6689 RepID=UPI00387F6969